MVILIIISLLLLLQLTDTVYLVVTLTGYGEVLKITGLTGGWFKMGKDVIINSSGVRKILGRRIV